MGVYQCNTTNMCGTQSPDLVNMCAMSPVQSLISHGNLNTDMLADLLGLLTAEPEQMVKKNPLAEAEIS